MGGSSDNSSFSSSQVAKLREAADARLRAIASKSTHILFVCETADRRTLDSHLARSPEFEASRRSILDQSVSAQTEELLSKSTFLVPFTCDTKIAKFIDEVIDKALIKKIDGVHVRGKSEALIPSKVGAYRWRSISWEELQEIFK